MPTSSPPPLLSPRASQTLGWSAVYALLVISIFTLPLTPLVNLDASWRMALGYFYEHGMQFGRDVIFTYGPLGFIMSKTSSEVHFGSMLIGQLILALISAAVILRQGQRLQGNARFVFFGFFLLFGIRYEDALHMLTLAMLGFELLRMVDEQRKSMLLPIAVVFAGYAQIKFTDLLFATFIILVAASYNFLRKKRQDAAVLALSYAGAFLGLWISCGQSVLNLPAFFYGSWQISEGYQWAMGVPTDPQHLWPGLVVLSVVVGYAGLHLFLNPDKPRGVANVSLLGVFTYLNWKHGFVRPDGHMLGFYFCALLPVVAYPALLDDPLRFQRAHRWAFILALLFGLWSLENARPGVVKESLGIFQGKIWTNLESIIKWQATKGRYEQELAAARRGSELAQTRKLVGNASLDVLGFEQGVALFNDFNYRPRPSIQGYSTFTPALAQMNGDFFASEHAPEFVLMKLQTIDNRLPTMDDAQVLLLLAHRYKFIHSERNYQLWRRNPGPFDPETIAPRLIRSERLEINHPLVIEDLSQQQPLWLRVDLQPSLLGRIRSFLYKPPQVMLSLQDSKGNQHDYLMPLPLGRNGFIINPLIEDLVDYMQFAINRPQKRVNSITLKITPENEKYLARSASVEVSSLPPASSATEYFRRDASAMRKLFPVFDTFPVAYDAHAEVVKATIEGKPVALLHAPSQMIFDVPVGEKTVSGRFGFVEAAYTNGGWTNGARFVVYCSDGTNRIDLFQQFLNPVTVPADRGLHEFSVPMKGTAGMRLYLETEPGPFNDNSWDWTCWVDINISQ